MAVNFTLIPLVLQKLQTQQEIEKCNDFTWQFGLCLSAQEIENLVERRFTALQDTGRIEFQQGILPQLIYKFADSPHLFQENYAETLGQLQEAFYYFKNESMDLLDDEEIITFMRKHFDTTCEGSVEYLQDMTLEQLCRKQRFGEQADD